MSELKPYIGPHPTDHTLTEYYLKSEADKVIAEKDAKILALDAEVFKQKHHAKLFFDERNYAETQLRHQKLKLCLAMVKYCDMGLTYYNEKLDSFSCERADFFYKWYNRWWKIAEKFKEAK